MMSRPQPASYRPARDILAIADIIADPVAAASFPEHRLRFRNQRWAEATGLGALDDDEWVEHFGRFAPLAGSLEQPLALRYHGHQFRVYNPDIGDGRGFLFAQLRDGDDRLLDLGTKGSGQTPYSRFGDGRLTLKGGVREILATEMLEALGVNSSKTFSLIETGEQLHRGDEPSPTRSAVLVRLGHGHIRIGSFQRLAYHEDRDGLARLVDYSLRALYGVEPGADPAAQLLTQVVERTADLAASYMIAGFVHGVLNSDNIAITGESFDYGPWRFTPLWEPGFTAAYFDHQGLYAFGRQAEAIHWDVAQLAGTLTLLTETPPLAAALEAFPERFQRAVARRFCWRLGVTEGPFEATQAAVRAATAAMAETRTPIDRFFFDWRGGDCPPERRARYDGEAWAPFRDWIGARAVGRGEHPYWAGDAPCSMPIEEVEALWSAIAERDDWSPLDAKVATIRAMGEAHA
jgi:uncharacterized protein YdiU (UPF0061 family)